MRILNIIFLCLLFCEYLYANDIFETQEYELSFSSNNIHLIKENKINEIKIKSFQNQITKILTKKNLDKIPINNINYINSFVLNYKINNEKIINDNYFANIKINFNKKKIISYLIKNKLEFVNKTPDNFLLIIMETNDLNIHLFSEDNNYYKFLNNSIDESFLEYFKIPNLDFNDRFIFNQYHF